MHAAAMERYGSRNGMFVRTTQLVGGGKIRSILLQKQALFWLLLDEL
jgi:hypothetical protein